VNLGFQRRSVWPPSSKTYLIDTILHDRPMPNIYIRTKTDLLTKRNYREVVDGQQRLLAIQEFASGELVLGLRAKDFVGLRYEDLDDDQKRAFLEYKIGVVQLFNATDEAVLDIFHRINAYGLQLNKQELRHGRWLGAFRTAVEETSKSWGERGLWRDYTIMGLRERVRMADDELMAQMFGVVLEGVKDGGQPYIDHLYKDYDGHLPEAVVPRVNGTIDYILTTFPAIMQTGLARGPHFLMVVAAVAHARYGIPAGDLPKVNAILPPRDDSALTDRDTANANLGILGDILLMDQEDVPPQFFVFKLASAGTTQRIKSRAPRFLSLYKALLPVPLS
jgi:hypothetical protein